jgi:hypothetical protein
MIKVLRIPFSAGRSGSFGKANPTLPCPIFFN